MALAVPLLYIRCRSPPRTSPIRSVRYVAVRARYAAHATPARLPRSQRATVAHGAAYGLGVGGGRSAWSLAIVLTRRSGARGYAPDGE